jgi:hypothetical protein
LHFPRVFITTQAQSKDIVMPSVLTGNFSTKKPVVAEEKTQDSLEERFEREALKKLGGSIAFVSKKKVTWTLDDDEK